MGFKGTWVSRALMRGSLLETDGGSRLPNFRGSHAERQKTGEGVIRYRLFCLNASHIMPMYLGESVRGEISNIKRGSRAIGCFLD